MAITGGVVFFVALLVAFVGVSAAPNGAARALDASDNIVRSPPSSRLGLIPILVVASIQLS